MVDVVLPADLDVGDRVGRERHDRHANRVIGSASFEFGPDDVGHVDHVGTVESPSRLSGDEAASRRHGPAIQNVGASGALLVQPNQFKLQAMNGATVKPYSTSLVAFNAQDVRPINVGMGGFTQFVYEIAPDSTGYLFLMTPKPGGSVSMSWNVP